MVLPLVLLLLMVMVRASAAARDTPPPYEPNSVVEHGTLTFFDATGHIQSTGDINASPFVAYAAADGPNDSTDDIATMAAALPSPSQPDQTQWANGPLNFGNNYPVAGAPASVPATTSVYQGLAGDPSLNTFIASNPHPATDPASYQGLYQVRMTTSGVDGTDNQYWVADILVTGTTWMQVYPTPPTQAPTDLTLAVAPPSPQAPGTSVTLTAAVSPVTATGSVSFADGGVVIGSPVPVVAGTASLATSGLAQGTHSLAATFNPADPTIFFPATSQAVAFTVDDGGPPAVATTALPTGTVTAGFSATLRATDGSAPYSWSLSGSPPPGISLDPGTGALSGAPTAAGMFTLTATVSDASAPVTRSGSRSLTILVAPAPVITTPALPGAVVGTPYSVQLGAGQGQPPYRWSVATGFLPFGLTLSDAGLISGTPVVAGSANLVIQVADATSPSGAKATRAFALAVQLPQASVSVATSDLPDGTIGQPYATVLQATGGTGPYAWARLIGTLPPGLALDASGAISGTPAATGSYLFSVEVTDATAPHPQEAVADLVLTVGTVLHGGFWLASSSGDVQAFGAAQGFGQASSLGARGPMVGLTPAADNQGYWQVGADGGIFAFGSARFHGSLGGTHLNQPVVSMAATPGGGGYWLVSTDGGVFAFGDARFLGSMGGTHLNSPIVGMAVTPSGNGYWLVSTDGGVFAFGDARFLGSMGGTHLNSPIVGAAVTPSGNGYWLAAADGGVFGFGDAIYRGSMGGTHLSGPMIGMAATLDGAGYWLAAGDGGIFSYGDAEFSGSGLGANATFRGVAGLRTID